MCRSCWVGDHGMPVVITDDVLAAAHLIERLYEMPGCAAGGPLHWMLDDMNIDDGQFGDRDPVAYRRGLFAYLWDGSFDRWAQAGDRTDDAQKLEIQHTCEAILALFREMPESHRAAAIAWAFGWVGAELPDYAAHVRGLERRDRIEADAEAMLNAARALPPVEERTPPPTEKACVPVECPPLQEVNLRDYYAPLFADGPTVRLADVPQELRPMAEQYIQDHAPRITRGADGIVVESRGMVDGVIHPGPGAMFAPDAVITGPFADLVRVNPDGSAALTGVPLVDIVDPENPGNAPEFRWSSSYVVHQDGRVTTEHYTAEDVLAAMTFRASTPEAQPVTPTYAQAAQGVIDSINPTIQSDTGTD